MIGIIKFTVFLETGAVQTGNEREINQLIVLQLCSEKYMTIQDRKTKKGKENAATHTTGIDWCWCCCPCAA